MSSRHFPPIRAFSPRESEGSARCGTPSTLYPLPSTRHTTLDDPGPSCPVSQPRLLESPSGSPTEVSAGDAPPPLDPHQEVDLWAGALLLEQAEVVGLAVHHTHQPRKTGSTTAFGIADVRRAA